jgi:hypothetical protein
MIGIAILTHFLEETSFFFLFFFFKKKGLFISDDTDNWATARSRQRMARAFTLRR